MQTYGSKIEGDNLDEERSQAGDPAAAAQSGAAGGEASGAAGGTGGGDDNTDKGSVAGTLREKDPARNVMIGGVAAPRKALEVTKQPGGGRGKKRDADQSDELRALQANMLRLSRNSESQLLSKKIWSCSLLPPI